MVCFEPSTIRNKGMKDMKRLSTALLAAGLMTLGACGGSPANKAAANNIVGNDVYNVAPDDLGAGNLLGNEAGGNASGGANSSSNASGNSQ